MIKQIYGGLSDAIAILVIGIFVAEKMQLVNVTLCLRDAIRTSKTTKII